MTTRTIVVLEEVRDCRVALMDVMLRMGGFDVVGTAGDGAEGLRLILEKKPEVVLMGLMLPVMDGFEVLERLQEQEGYKPTVFIISAPGKDWMFRKALELGVEYCFATPMKSEKVIEGMKKLLMDRKKEKEPVLGDFLTEREVEYDPGFVVYQEEVLPPAPGRQVQQEVLYDASKAPKGPKDELREGSEAYGAASGKKKSVPLDNYFFLRGVPEQDVSLFLRGICMPTLNGYWYVRESVLCALDEPDLLQNVSARLFPLVACKWNTTGEKVDRSIRNCIDVAWRRRNEENLLFWSFLGYRDKRPSVKGFISGLTDKLLTYYEYRGV